MFQNMTLKIVQGCIIHGGEMREGREAYSRYSAGIEEGVTQ